MHLYSRLAQLQKNQFETFPLCFDYVTGYLNTQKVLSEKSPKETALGEVDLEKQ